jgi:hypothetical protein
VSTANSRANAYARHTHDAFLYNIHCALVFSLRVVLGTVGTSSGRRVTTAGACSKTTMTLSRPRVVEHTITDDHVPRQARDKHIMRKKIRMLNGWSVVFYRTFDRRNAVEIYSPGRRITGRGWPRTVQVRTANCIIIAPKRLKLRLSGSARKSQKRFRDTPRFKFQAVLARTQPFYHAP